MTLNDAVTGQSFQFCNMAHLFAWMIEGMGKSMQSVVEKAVMAAKNPVGRKAVVNYLMEKFL